MARETIKAVIRRNVLMCSFAPKASNVTHNGAHVHMSLWKDGKNSTVDNEAKF
jgi:glutamine synthetase